MEGGTGDAVSLPDDIIYKILLRLPGKSLCRFKIVSKHWLSTISDTQFAASHFDLSPDRPNLLISIPQYEWRGNKVGALIFSADYPVLHSGIWMQPRQLLEQMGQLMQQPWPWISAAFHGYVCHGGSQYTGVSKSCGGLICLEFGGSMLEIYNPITGETISFCVPDFATGYELYHRNHLGFDPVEKKYKVLSVWGELDNVEEQGNAFCFVSTLGDGRGFYYLEGGKKYPPLHGPFEGPIEGNGVCINGVIYYLSNCPHTIRNDNWIHLIAFDLKSETFEAIPLPIDFGIGSYFLKKSGECVSVLRLPFDFGEDESDIRVYTLKNRIRRIWSREDYMVPTEWKRVIKHEYLAGVTPKGELVFVPVFMFDQLPLYIYNVEASYVWIALVVGLHEHIDKTPLIGHESFIRVGAHMESLQSLKGLQTTYENYRCLYRRKIN